MKIVSMSVAVLLAAAVGVHADLYWENSVAITDSGSTPLAASWNDPTVGCFAQLIMSSGTTANPFVNSGSGVSGGDAVMATMYCGMGDEWGYSDGIFPMQGTAAVSGSAGNGYYYVRAFDGAQTLSEWNNGTAAAIPTSAAYYWESAVHEYTHNASLPDRWDFAASGGSTLNMIAVPEPTTLAFLGLGFGALLLRRKVRK
ncbi:MAG: PEP-CTERM sorting domain-containing protein [Kiritimatiellae bacterium]|nr:PEP-CTERM sorting domain-containing protein [Kiritimatiellia bacterium]